MNLNQFDEDIEEIKGKQLSRKSFSVEVTLTEGCNWNCEYCFEGVEKKTKKVHMLNKNPKPLLDFIDNMMESDWFKDRFDYLNIDFWGGEPTLNLKLMNLILQKYKDEERVRFFIYTNGSKMEDLIPLILPLKDLDCKGKEKILVQVSYDGNPIHDLRRLDCNGKQTSRIVKSALSLLFKNDIPCQLKSTLMSKDFKYMSECWDDIHTLRKQYGESMNYAPTIDYYTTSYNEEHYKDLERNLLDIAKKEILNSKERNKFTLSWFSSPHKSVCGSGKSMFAVDINGNVHFCHGCIYGNQLCYANIYQDEKLLDRLKRNYDMLDFKVYNDECERCEATVCLRCNYLKYKTSKKNKFTDKFYDLTAQPDLCRYYKLIGKISRAIDMIGG